MHNYQEIALWQDVSLQQWQDWKWQMRHRLHTADDIQAVVTLTADEKAGLENATCGFPVGITPYYANLMNRDNPKCPIRQQAIPVAAEGNTEESTMRDPLGEDDHSPVPFITHRYPDRVLFIVTEMCPVYCRHCTRRRLVGANEGGIPRTCIDKAIAYIAQTPAVRDVLVSGGDPLTLGDDRLDYILGSLRRIPHVEVIRIGTRAPVTNPFRITAQLCEMLRQYHPIWINTHFNHPNELTAEAIAACARIVDAGIPLGNQTVLLRGINDCPQLQKKLVQQLVKARVRPYYLYQCDLSQGLEHFRTPVAAGIEIMEFLRGHTSGYAIPTFVIDAPGGCGKIPVAPNYLLSQSPTHVVLRNYEGRTVAYPEPVTRETHSSVDCVYCQEANPTGGVAGLLHQYSHL
jgi:lysine 2,3-aminomutase